MVALWIRLGTTLAGDGALGIRLMAPISAALGSFALVRAGDRLFGPGVGLRAALLLSATLLFGVGAVTMTPDTPLLFFWTLAIVCLARVAGGGHGAWWLAVGVTAGLALDSKYTAAVLGIGIVLWLLHPGMRHWLRSPWPWAGGAIAAALFAPVIAWNATHGWASFVKQGGRAGDFNPARALTFLAELIGGQAGLATPIIFILFVLGAASAVRRWRSLPHALTAALILPGAALFLQHALGDRVQANWVAILYPAAALAAASIGQRGRSSGPGQDPSRIWTIAAILLAVTFTAALYLQAVRPFPLSRGIDPTQRLAGWNCLQSDAQAAARRIGAGFIASEEYGTASLLSYPVSQPCPRDLDGRPNVLGGGAPAVRTIAAEPRWRLFDIPHAAETGPGLLLISARRTQPPDPAFWQTAEPLGTIARTRAGVELEIFRLYRVALRSDAPAVRLPP